MDTLQGIVERLTAWAAEHHLVKKAMHGCERCFVTEGGTVSGWAVTDIQMVFRSHCLCFTANFPDAHIVASLNPYIVTSLDLYALGGAQIGQYRLITTLEGKADDDYLVLDLDKQEYLDNQE